MQLLTFASAGSGTAYPGGFLMSARQADPSGAAAHQAARSAAGQEAQKNAAIETVKAGAPAASGNSASKADATIFQRGRKARPRQGRRDGRRMWRGQRSRASWAANWAARGPRSMQPSRLSRRERRPRQGTVLPRQERMSTQGARRSNQP